MSPTNPIAPPSTTAVTVASAAAAKMQSCSGTTPTAPAKADAFIVTAPAPSTSASSAPSDAPPDTPSTYGSASAFLSSTCSSVLASASSPPHANAPNARGARRFHTISCTTPGAGDIRLPRTWPTLIEKLPKVRPARTLAIDAMPSAVYNNDARARGAVNNSAATRTTSRIAGEYACDHHRITTSTWLKIVHSASVITGQP